VVEIVAPVADTHSNSRTGLCPPQVELEAVDTKGYWNATATQLVMWKHWCEHWDYLKWLKKKLKARLTAIVDGDGSDDNSHGKAGLISTNKNDILVIGAKVLEPMLAVADTVFIVRGTRSHVGEAAWQEEAIAKEIEAERDEQAGTFSWWWLPAMFEGVKFHIAHKPPTTGHKPWTFEASLGRCSKELRDDYRDRGEQPPDIALFAHYHKFGDSGIVNKPYVVALPSWSVADAYLMQIGKAGARPEIGGVWFICKDGKYKFDYKVRRLRGKETWRRS